MGEAVAAVEVRRQIETLRDKYQEETRREEQELREEQKRLGERQSTLEPAEFERERNLFQKKVRDTQRKVQARSRGLDVTFAKAMEQLRTGLVSIVSDLTAEMGFNIVLEKSQIIMADKTLDITDTVLERLNKRVPKVTIEPLPDPNSTAN